MKKIKEWSYDKIIVELGCLFIALSGVMVSIRMNFQGHSLWWDEAALAYSFSQRDILHLTSAGLEKLQSAPVGWLYFLKIMTMIFGNTDFVLRVPSIMAYIGTLILVFVILHKVFQVRYPMAGVAFVASLPIVLQYSNIFKPYISDCFFCLLTIWFFYLYRSKKWNWIKLSMALAVVIWFSNPTCFVAGGMIAVIFLEGLFQKEKDKVIDIIKACIPLMISFGVYYVYWLRQTATDDTMLYYWKDWNLPLIPRSLEDISQIIKCAGTIFAEFYRLEYIIIILLAVFLIYAFKKHDTLYLGLYFGIAVCLVASGLGMFPVNKRLWLFVYPICTIMLVVGLDGLIDKTEKSHMTSSVVGFIMLGCCLLNGGVRYYANMDNCYWPRYEVKMAYNYIVDNIQEDEGVYVCVNQTPIFDYYNHYVDGYLENTDNPVMEGDNDYLQPYDYKEDIEFIVDQGKCYLMMGDGWTVDFFMEQLFFGLYEEGYLELVYNPYETPLWYYCSDLSDTKTEVSYHVDQTEDGEMLQLQNVGDTYLNMQYETLQLVVYNEDNDQEIMRYSLIEEVAPGETLDVKADLGGAKNIRIVLENGYKSIVKEQIIQL